MPQPCSVDQCDRRATAKGLCQRHYQAQRYELRKAGLVPTKPCSVPGCIRPLLAKGLCGSHYNAKRDGERRAAVRGHHRPCVVCGADLTGRPPNAMYCTIRCKEQARESKRKEDAAYKAGRAARYKSQAGAVRASNLWIKYGLTVEQFDQMREDQDNRCAICRTETPGGHGTWHIDHDHETGRVRGLLCHGCNVGLGNLADSPDRLRVAIAYLERPHS